MNRSDLVAYLQTFPEAMEDYPFGPDVAVYKVRGKMFALLMHREGSDQVNLKCDPDQANSLRDIFAAVRPAYHMNKKHWNTVVLDGSVPAGEIERMADHSYRLVIERLTRKQRLGLELQYGRAALFRDLPADAMMVSGKTQSSAGS